MLGLLLVFLWSFMPIAAITWRADVGGAVYSSPVFSPSGALYVCSYDGNLYSIAANGSRVWRIFLGPLYYSPLFVQGMAEAVPHASESPKILAGYNIGGGGLGVVASVSTEGRLLSRDSFGAGSLQCAPQHLQGSFLSCNDGGDIVALSGDGRGQLWSADVHGGGVLSNIVTFNDVLEGMLCVGGAAHRIVCLDINGSTIWNTFGGGGAGDYVTVLSSARGGSSLVSGAFDLCLHTIYHSPA
jgi:outer membrane protein assembly factor BamB